MVRSVRSPANTIGMEVVDVSGPVLTKIADINSATDRRIVTLASLTVAGSSDPANDLVGIGDILSIGLYEVGVGMFGGGGQDALPSARAQEFETVPVDRTGSIKLPYLGALKVVGHTPQEIGALIERGFAGRSQSPQAIVLLRRNLANTVYVTGDVRKPGRIELSLRSERLMSAIAEAGGPVSQAQDMVVRVSRSGTVIEERLDQIRAGAADDITLKAGDVADLIKEPQTYSIFGAVTKATQIPFDQTNLTLAEAIARAGGPNDALANPKAVFLFRYTPSTSTASPKPTIYRLNMMQPESYFLAQKFAMRDKDVLYVSNANINRISKFVGIITQLTSPFITARVLTQ